MTTEQQNANGELQPVVRATRFEVNCVPETDTGAWHFAVTVVYCRGGRWVVRDRDDRCYDFDGVVSWDYGSDAPDEWLARYRFTDVEQALEVAKRVAPTITVNGVTVAEALANPELE
ncbi:hypothetical protein [Nocardia sp. NPDC052566]|uniref:hypothetical protein n=1 Tax=Nocardia sp. NPDC052566 TaxID=3364330 RepID=UPI0037C9E390